MKTEVKLIKCVIIDDEIEACDRLQSLLEKIPTISIVAIETKVETGIKKVIEYSPDLVILDVEMPKENGLEVVKEIRTKNVFPTFIFVSGYNQYAIKAIRSAAFDYLLKPVDIDELREAIVRYANVQKEKIEIILPQKLKTQYSLTDREIEIVKLLMKGKSSGEIGELLFISKNTVDTHRRNILEKTNTTATPNLISQILSW